MKPLDRRRHWQGVYRSKESSDVSWFQQEPQHSLTLIHRAGISPGDPVIDIGGGTSVLVDCLLDAGFADLSVLDVSADALAHSRQRLADRGEQVTWLIQDVTHFQSERRFALWHDRAVFHFLTRKSDRRRYIETLCEALQSGGHLVMACFALDGPEKCSGLPVERYDADKLGGALGPAFVLQETLRETHVTPAGAEQRFAWFRYTYKP